jgi:acetyl-CoA carboxylase carboxyl transferase subunit beta
MAWYKRSSDSDISGEKRSVPAGVFTKCSGCRETLLTADLHKNLHVCPKCEHHFVMPTLDRIDLMIDAGTWVEADSRIESVDPLGFRDSKRYPDRIKAAKKQTGASDALRAGRGKMEGLDVEAGFFAFEFMGGSMGSVVGEKVTRVYERALDRRVPALIFCASGGARMQEGLLSLMQMAKTSAAISRLRQANVPLFSILLHPTTGGVAASFAMLGDVIIAEPKAQIGFAGARVIQNTIRQALPPGFQRSEFLLKHGFVDCVVHRRELKATIARLLRLLLGLPAPAGGGAAGTKDAAPGPASGG